MGKRIELIDVAKGISIILVAFSHSELASIYSNINQVMSLFRLPLFFLLAGVFFSASSRPKDYILDKTDALLKPYFVTLFLILFVSILSKEKDIMYQAIGILYGNGHTIRWDPLWFLTHLWCVFILSYILFHYTKIESQSKLVKILLVFSLILIGSFFMRIFWELPVTIFGKELKLPGLPFSIDIVFLSMAYFIAGHFLNHSLKEFTPKSTILIVTIVIFVFIATLTEASTSFNMRVYHKPVLVTIAAFSGIYVILSASYYICKNKLLTKFLTAFGSASLIVLIFHKYIGNKTYDIISHLLNSNYTLLCGTLAFFASITVPLLIRKVLLMNDFIMLFYFPLKSNKLLRRMRKANHCELKQLN